MKKERKVWAITLIAFWWLAPNQTNAQQDSLQTTQFNEVVVTATKFPKSLSETGKVVTVIDEAHLQRSAGKDLSQLLNEQAGIIITGANSNPGKDKSVLLRGAASQYTLILLDGIPVTDPSGTGGAFDLRMLPIENVERIEILKGSQSTLYGSDAIAGVINIITKKKGEKKLGGFATAGYGSYNTLRANAGISGSTRVIDYHVTATRFKTDGISEATDQTGTGNFDRDGFEQRAVQASVGIRPSEKISVNPFFRYTQFDGRYDGGAFTDDRADYSSTLRQAGALGQYNGKRFTLHAQYSRTNTDRTFTSSFGGYPFTGYFDHAEAFIDHKLGTYFHLLGGINYQHLAMKDDQATRKDPAVSIVSPYISFFIKNLNGFSAEAGARYNRHEQFGSTVTYSINPSYLINNRVKFFVNYSTGFKAPTLSELYGAFGANKNLTPQESNHAEAGLQYLNQAATVDVRVAVFDRRVRNAIVYGSTGFMNLDKQNDRGIEIEPNFRINEKLSIKTFYAFVTGELTTKTTDDRDTTYNNLFRRPRHSFGVLLNYAVTKKFFASVNLKTFGARSDLFFTYDPVTFESITRQVRLAAYELLDVYLEYRIHTMLKVFVDARNILDQRYSESCGYNTLRFNVTTGLTINL